MNEEQILPAARKSAKNVKEEKASFLYLLSLARPPFPSARTSDAICGFSVERTDIIMYVHRNNGYSKDTAPPSGTGTEAALEDRHSNATVWSEKL